MLSRPPLMLSRPPLMLSLSKHVAPHTTSFDKLRTSGIVQSGSLIVKP